MYQREVGEVETEGDDVVQITESSGNVFVDLGLPNPEEDLLKAQLLGQIQRFMREKELTQAELAALIGLDQPKISRLLRGRLADFSVERLLTVLNRLGHRVEVRISPEEVAPEAAQTLVLVS